MQDEPEKQEHFLPVDQVINMPKVKVLVPAIQEQMLSGDFSPLKAQIFFKKIGKLAEEIVKGEKGTEVQEAIEKEIRSFQEGKTSRVYSTEIREQSRGYWDYTECNDPIWDELTKIDKQVKELKKAREKELQLQMPTPGLGLKECKISVPYFPKFELEDNTDLAIINPPFKGGKTLFAFFL